MIVKIAIVRFFKHMEAGLVPLLGTGLLICTVLLLGLALPTTFREAKQHCELMTRNYRKAGKIIYQYT